MGGLGGRKRDKNRSKLCMSIKVDIVVYEYGKDESSTVASHGIFFASTYLGNFFKVPPCPLHPRKFEL